MRNKRDVVRILLDRLKENGQETKTIKKEYTCSKSFISKGQTKLGRRYNELIYLSEPNALLMAGDYNFAKLINRARGCYRQTHLKALVFVNDDETSLICAILTVPRIYARCKKFILEGRLGAALVTASLICNNIKKEKGE